MNRKRITTLVCFAAITFCFNGCQEPSSTSTLTSLTPKSMEVNGEIKEKYAVNEKIDYSYFSVDITYDNGSSKKYYPGSEALEITGGETSTLGTHELKFSCEGLEKVFHYEVCSFELVLDFNGGTLAVDETEKTSITINTTDYYVDISAYQPQKVLEDGTVLQFAGWFLNKNLTERIKQNVDGLVAINKNQTLYAGFDYNYDSKFSYVIGEDQTVSLSKVLDYDEFLFAFDPIDYEIPLTIKGYPVVAILDDFFDQDTLSFIGVQINHLIFPENSQITKIGDSAFENVKISHINFPDKLQQIGNKAFCNSNINDKLTLPASLERIGDEAFAFSQILDIDFAKNGNLTYIGSGCFMDSTRLTSVEFPESLKQIRSEAFEGCLELETIYLSSTVSEIGIHAFRNMPKLREFIVSENNLTYCSIDGNLYSKDKKIFYRYCFAKKETEFILPDTIETIYDNAFDITSEVCVLDTIKINEGLTYIGSEAFKECSASFTLPASITNFSLTAFLKWQGKEFKISKDNPLFTVKDGALYSKDLKRLYSVPANYQEQTFVLDDECEVIQNFALIFSHNIQYIRINKSSKLSSIREFGLVPFTFDSLIAVYIDKVEPFALEKNACFYENSYHTSFRFVVPQEAYQNYVEAWKDYENTIPSASFIDDQIQNYVATSSMCEEQLKQITLDFEMLNNLSYDAFTRGVPLFFKDSFYSVNVQMQDFFSMLDCIYNSREEIVEKSYFIEIEKAIYTFLISSYRQVEDLPTKCKNLPYYQSLLDRISYLPQFILDNMGSIMNECNLIQQEITDIVSRREQVIKKIRDFKFDPNSFDLTYFETLRTEFDEYSLYSVVLSNTENQNWNKIYCSALIYQFLQLDITYENYNELKDLYYGDNANYLGIQGYLRSYLTTDVLRSDLYHYDAFLLKEVEFLDYEVMTYYEDYGLIINECAEAIDAFDNLGEYDKEAYEELYKKCEPYLRDLPYDQLNKLLVICNRIDAHALIEYYENNPISDETIIVYMNYMNSIMVDSLMEEALQVQQILEEASEYYEQRMEYFSEALNQLDATTFEENYPKLDTFYQQYKSTINLGDSYNGYTEEYFKILALYCTYDILTLKNIVGEKITKENYESVYKSLYGYYDETLGVEVGGIADFIQEMSKIENSKFMTYLEKYCGENLEWYNNIIVEMKTCNFIEEAYEGSK